MKILATGNDELVIGWIYTMFGIVCTNIDLAVAVLEDGKIVGAAVYHAHNGPDIELSYYGPKSVTLGVAKGVAKIAVDHFGVSRITVRTAKDNEIMNKSIHKLGFVREGIRHHAYGENDAIMYGLFGRKLARLAGKVIQ
jgi:RimJ/RimL family protein N-acetyltransferase